MNLLDHGVDTEHGGLQEPVLVILIVCAVAFACFLAWFLAKQENPE